LEKAMHSKLQFPIVGIGASAGGIPALQAFFENLPADAGMAFVVVTHMNPDRETLLPEILGRFTPFPVVAAQHNAKVAPDHVYVMPSSAVMTIEDGRLQLAEVDRSRRERKPVDLFLAALAKDQGEYAVAIVLSGGDGDGTLGAKAVKEAGGLTMAQAPDGSGPIHPQMPETAIASGVIDLALSAEEMGRRLVAYKLGFGTLDTLQQANDARVKAKLERVHREVCAILVSHSGHDFSGYKTKTFFRRMQRRMQVCQVTSPEAYVDLLKHDASEVGHLFRDLLINVTNFFRDEDAFAALSKLVIPRLFEGKGANDTVRVWVPGCATGEEVYSLAILMREHMQKIKTVPRIQLFATDIDEQALAIARAGRYPAPLLEGISKERLQRFFKSEGEAYTIASDVRELCIFSPHSLIRDPPFSRMDLVSCRNLLIYFGPDVQRRVVPTFHYSLKAGGYLFLGSSESLGQHADLFTTLDKKQRIFQAREHRAQLPRFPDLPSHERSFVFPEGTHMSGREGGQSLLRQQAERRILERHAPAHVVVTPEADVLYLSANIGRFLELAQGMPTRQLLTLARKGLRLDLRAALQECAANRQPTSRLNVAVDRDDGLVQLADITVEPIEGSGGQPLYLVVFQAHGTPQARTDTAAMSLRRHGDNVGELERELRDTKEKLQSTIEEYETALEELKSSNEELVSVNEEIQSSNEELEASKEETQSLNEELSTINAELSSKIDDLDRANSDLRNLFESTQVATVFLDQQLVIRTFTPAAATFFNLRPGDIGRPLTELSSQLDYPRLKDDIRDVFTSGASHSEQLTRDNEGKYHLVKLIPYRSQHANIDGVVVTLVDVTQIAEAEQRQQVLVSELNHRVKNLLAVVMSIATRTLDGSASPEAFRKAFLGRMQAMARAYGSLSKEGWADASIRTIFNTELDLFGEANFTLSGPEVRLQPQTGLSLALVAHELTTNASKYGALSNASGRVEVSWAMDENVLRLTWRERGGPPVSEPDRTGFGFELLHGEIEYRMQGKVDAQYHADGLVVRIDMPMEAGAAD
jgi:two-component system CheB/CheR fusion protein